MNKANSRRKMLAVFAVFLSLAVLFAPFASYEDTDAASGDIYTYTISTDGTISGYNPIGTSSSSGSYTSVNGTNSGSWAFDEDGYGPFNSFYAAFDPAQNNRMIGHLDPDDLTKLVDGTSIAGQDYNIMWCLPTVYWKTSGTSLVLTNDPSAGGTAYAHTINGHVYNYIAIGVYEASTDSVSGQTILTSYTDATPLVSQTRATFRDYANNQLVNTDGNGTNGYAMVWNFYQWELYKYCALAVMGSWNSQGVAGNGDVYGGSPYYHITGDLDQSGPYAGTKGSSTTYYQDSVKVFIENAWGSVYDFVDGVVIYNNEYYIDQSAVPTDSYTAGGYVTNPNGTLPGSSGYGSSPSTEAAIWGMPTATGGSSSSGLYDYVYSSSGGPYVVFVGGYSYSFSSNAPNYGLSYANCNTVLSRSASAVGGRLAFVFDADPASGNTVTFDHGELTSAGGNASGLATSVTVPTDESYQLPNLGTVGEFTHIGWRVNGQTQPVNYTITPTENMTVTSLWRHNSTITFDHSALTDYGQSASGLATSSGAQPDGQAYTLPSLGMVGGYTHTGWYIDGLFYAVGAQYTPSGNITAYSVWQQPMITITYVVEGQNYATLTVPGGSSGIVFTPLMVDGVFEGWYYDSSFQNKYNASQALDANTTLYAKGVPPLVFTSVPTANAQITAVAGTNSLYYFDATDSDGRYQVHWDFGDGNTSDDVLAYNEYAQPGVYTVTLTVTNSDGESAVSTYTVDTTDGTDDVGDEDDGPGILVYVAIVIVIVIVAGVVLRRVL